VDKYGSSEFDFEDEDEEDFEEFFTSKRKF
jgi:hypothetical protein